jgi:light-regulated signal transduction histidine kinase (bacteriophytochrome)
VATGPTGPTEPSPVRQDDDSLDFVPSAQGPSLAGGVEDPLPRETLTDISSGAAIKHQHENSQLPGSYLPPPWPAVPPKTSLRSIPESQLSSDDHGTGQTTERARLIPTTSGPPGISPGLICGNTTRRYYRCEDEPIHTPGAIQQFGALVALRYNEQNDLEVRIASENSLGLLERTPHQLFELKTFVDIFDPSSREDVVSRIQDAIKKVTKSEERDSAMQTQLEIIHTIITTPHGLQKQLWCAIHVSFGTQDLVVCEFEEYSPKFYLGDMYLKSTLPEHPVSTVDMELDPEEQRKSFTRQNRPLRVLEIARRRKNNDVPSMDVFGAMTDAQSQLANCKSVQEILEVIVGIVSELTGFHRVMFYRFDSMNNGCVDAEYVDPKASEDLFRGKSPLLQDKVITNLNIGLHYPASDIPPQARKLYELNRIRILYDRDAETARLVGLPFIFISAFRPRA